MTAWLHMLITGTWLLTLALLFVMATRHLTRRFFGSSPVYTLWAIPALICCVVSLAPHPAGPRILATNSIVSDALSQTTDDPTAEMAMILFACWVAGLVASIALNYVHQRNFHKQLGETIQVGYVGNIPLLISSTLTSPVACGILNKRIVVPEFFERLYSTEDQHLILCHELTHLQRNDSLANLFANFICSVFWFHPLAYWAKKLFRIDQELACDEQVLRQIPTKRATYGNALLKAAVLNNNSVIGWQSSKAAIKQRIKAVATPARSQTFRYFGISVVTSLTVVASLLSQRLLPQDPPTLLGAATHASILANMPQEELGQNLLHAIKIGDSFLVRRLLSFGAPIEFAKPGVGTPLILAAAKGHYNLVKLLVENHANVNATVVSAGSPLIMAAKYDRREIANFLIDHGGNVNTHVFLDETPLINAARFGHVDMARYLIEMGAEPHKTVTTFSITHLPLGSKSPMSEAQRSGHTNVVSLLESLDS